MGQRQQVSGTREHAVEQMMRDQEVLRANKELAAYFKGQRTEREARAALKIIKAFVRDRERRDPSERPPLPGAQVAQTPKPAVARPAASARGKRHRTTKSGAKRAVASGQRVTASIPPPEPPQPPDAPDSGE